jgi:hypothetical protein
MDLAPVTIWRKRWKKSGHRFHRSLNFIQISALAELDGFSRLEPKLPFLNPV